VWHLFAILLMGATLLAHSGPPFPIVSSRAAGAYEISVWTDPDTTDDGSAGGQFWVTLRPSSGVPPADRPDQTHTATAEPVARDAAHRFAALPMDREGRFHVRVTVDGPLGHAAVEADVDATYDLRPPPAMLAMYAIPFVLVGFLWIKLLLNRSRKES
jgi:hypothetical protein